MDTSNLEFPNDWEITIVDDESEAPQFEEFRARYPWVRFFANLVNSGFAHGCNLSVAQASGEQLLFMNPDVIAGCGASDQSLK